jgi:hypothetical protein
MDALKHIPDNVNMLRTEKGDARLQKTDIFKKLMWFAYPREESWIPLTINKVKEIQAMNKEGIIPPDLGELAELETKIAAKVLDYENVVGQDSLTRLDERRNNNKKKNKNKNKGPNPNQQPGNQQARPQGNPTGPAIVAKDGNKAQRPEGNRQPRPEGSRPDGERPQGNNNNRRNKHRRPNQNNQSRSENPGRPTE